MCHKLARRCRTSCGENSGVPVARHALPIAVRSLASEVAENACLEVAVFARNEIADGLEDTLGHRNPSGGTCLRVRRSDAPAALLLVEITPPERRQLRYPLAGLVERDQRQPVGLRDGREHGLDVVGGRRLDRLVLAFRQPNPGGRVG